MNRIYRLVRDRSTGTLKAVGEFARSHQAVGTVGSSLLVSLISLTPPLAFGAEQAKITVASGNTQVFQAPNGVQEVDIATANAAGVSHNKYNDYNVSTSGLILNNNSPLSHKGALQSQLGGQIVPNVNLSNEASVIINEVVSQNPSALRGFTEVVGGKADVVVANPYGITCDGCGFLNTDRVTLSTGKPTFGNNGGLTGFNVSQGQVTIGTNGIDGTNQNILDLVSRNIVVNGKVNGKDVKLIAGRNGYSYKTRQVTSHTDDKPSIQYAIDSSALGGMYVNRIQLIATDKGIGVRMKGDVAATGSDFKLSASGKIELVNNTINAQNNVEITSDANGDAKQGGIAISGAKVTAASQAITLTGTNKAGIHLSDGNFKANTQLVMNAETLSDTSTSQKSTRFANENTQVTIAGQADIQGSSWGAGEQLIAKTGALTLTDAKVYSGSNESATKRDLQLTSQTGDIELASSTVTSPAAMTINADGHHIHLDGKSRIESEKALDVTASEMTNAGSVLSNDNVTIKAKDTKQVSLTNQGVLQSKATLTIGDSQHQAVIDNQSTGNILANTIEETASSVTNAGRQQASHTTLTANTLTNKATGQLILSTSSEEEANQITLTDQLSNEGQIQSKGNVNLSAKKSITNSGTILVEHAQSGLGNQLNIDAGEIDNSGTVDGGGHLALKTTDKQSKVGITNTGYIQSKGKMTLTTASSVTNKAKGNVLSGDTLTLSSSTNGFLLSNQGWIQADKTLQIGSNPSDLQRPDAIRADFVNDSQGTIYSQSDLNFSTTTFSNTGTIFSHAQQTIDTLLLQNAGKIKSDSMLKASATNALTNQSTGEISAAGISLTTTTAELTNDGAIESSAGLNLTSAGKLANSGKLFSQKAMVLKTTAPGPLLASSETIESVNNSGTVESASTLLVNASDAFTNAQNGKFRAAGISVISTNGAVKNEGSIESSETMDLSAAKDLSNSGKLIAEKAMTLKTTTPGQTLSNSGTVDSASQLTVTTSDAFTNTQDGQLRAAGVSVISTAGAVKNEGSIESSETMDLSAAKDLSNSGKLIAEKAMMLKAATPGQTLTNSGTVDSASQLTITASDAFTNASNGQLRAAGISVTSTAGTVKNEGSIESSETMDFSAAKELSNSGKLIAEKAMTLKTTTPGQTLSNSGTVDSASQLTVTTSDAFTNTQDGQLRAAGVSVTSTAGAVKNEGSIESSETMEISAAKALSNSGKLIAGKAMTLETTTPGQTLSNSGAVDSASQLTIHSSHLFTNTQSGTVTASGVMVSSSTGDIANEGSIASSSNMVLSSAQKLSNGGKLYAQKTMHVTSGDQLANHGSIVAKSQLTLTATNAVSNQSDGKVSAAGVSLHSKAGSLANDGAIESSGNMDISTAKGVSNSGNLISTTDLTLKSTTSDQQVTNSGRIQSGKQLSIGQTGPSSHLSNENSGVIFSGSLLKLKVVKLNNQGKIFGTTGSSIQAGQITNGNQNNHQALIFGAQEAGQSSLTSQTSLTNYGAIHSNDTLQVNASGVTNTDTGGISSLTNLILDTSEQGDIQNKGALYAGTSLTLNAKDKSITNNAKTGTMDSDGNITVTSANFTNNNKIVAQGDISITTTKQFKNETVLAGGQVPVKSEGSLFSPSKAKEVKRISSEGGGGKGATVKLWEDRFYQTETLNGQLPSEKAQIISSGKTGNLTINYGDSGSNSVAVLSAPSVSISGKGTFTNKSLDLYEKQYFRRWITVKDSAPFHKTKHRYWACTNFTWCRNDTVGSHGHNHASSFKPGYHNGQINGWSKRDSEKDARAYSVNGKEFTGTATVIKQSGAGIFAKNFNFGSGKLKNEGSPWADSTNSNHVLSGSPQSARTIQKNESGGKQSGMTIQSATTVIHGKVSLHGKVSGPGGNISAHDKATDIQGIGAEIDVSRVNQLHSQLTGYLSFAGLDIRLPSNPNGYFVTAKDPDASYLIETNPLFKVGSNFVGSQYLADRYNYNPDDSIRRLGDDSYEAYLIRQQLIDQTGSNKLSGFSGQSEATQMKSLMDNALSQAKQMNLVYGQGLTQNQVRNLTQDMVWMVETEVNGQKVLVPQVYLAQNTVDSIQSGAVIAANHADIHADKVDNTGGVIAGKDSLNIQSKGDVTNTSGTITGGDVKVASSEGSIINQTHVEGHGDALSYETGIGKTASISSTKNLDLKAKKNIEIKGAKVSSEGDASIEAGENLTVDTIVDKKTKTSVKSKATLFGSSTTTTTESSETNIASTLDIGGKLKTKSGKDTTIAGSKVKAEKGWDVEGGNVSIIAREDKHTKTVEKSESGLGVGGGIYGTKKSLKEDSKSTNVGSMIELGDQKDLLAKRKIQKKREVVLKNMKDMGATIADLDTEYQKLDPSSEQAKALRQKALKIFGKYKTLAGDSAAMTKEIKAINSADLNIKTKGKVTIQGSELMVSGKGDIQALEGIDILDGFNEERHHERTETTAFGKFSSSSHSGSGSGSDSSSNLNHATNGQNGTASGSANASASANAQANAGSSQNISLYEKTVTEKNSGKRTSVGSTLNFGDGVTLKSQKDLNIVGSSIIGDGVDVSGAKNVNISAGRNESWSSSKTSKSSIGMFNDSKASANANANANASATANASVTSGAEQTSNANANSSATAHAGSTTTLGVRTEKSQSSSYDLTHTKSSIKSFGNLSVKAGENITFSGVDAESAADMSIDGKNVINKAVQDVHTSSHSSSSETKGAYISRDVEAHAEASAQVDGNQGSAGAQADAGASAEQSQGYRTQSEGQSSHQRETKNVTNTFKSGGNFSRKAKNMILDEGTSVEAGGSIIQSSKTYHDKAVYDTQTSSASSHSQETRVGTYNRAEASAGASTSEGKSSDAGVSSGIKASHSQQSSASEQSSSTAVTSKFKARRSINLKTSDNMTLEGTAFDANKDISLDAGSLDYQSVKDTTASSATNSSFDASGEVGAGAPEASANVDLSKEKNHNSSTKTHGGSLSANGNISITTRKGDTNLEATDIKSGSNVVIDAQQGDVNMTAAQDKASSSSKSGSLSVSASLSDGEVEAGAQGQAGYDARNETKANTGSIEAGQGITIKSKHDITLEGTTMRSKGDTALNAGNKVELKAAENHSSSVGMNVSGQASTTGDGSASASLSASKQVTSDVTSIQTGGKLKIDSKKVVSQGAILDANKGKSVTGNVVHKKAKQRSVDGAVSVTPGSVSGSTSVLP